MQVGNLQPPPRALTSAIDAGCKTPTGAHGDYASAGIIENVACKIPRGISADLTCIRTHFQSRTKLSQSTLAGYYGGGYLGAIPFTLSFEISISMSLLQFYEIMYLWWLMFLIKIDACMIENRISSFFINT